VICSECSIVTALSDLQQMVMSPATINAATDGTVLKIKITVIFIYTFTLSRCDDKCT
jgi:hypothetical protein